MVRSSSNNKPDFETTFKEYLEGDGDKVSFRDLCKHAEHMKEGFLNYCVEKGIRGDLESLSHNFLFYVDWTTSRYGLKKRVYKKFGPSYKVPKVMTWLSTKFIKNEFKKKQRSVNKNTSFSEEQHTPEARNTSTEELVAYNEFENSLFNRIPQKYRKFYELKLEGHTNREIAKETGKSEKAISKIFKRVNERYLDNFLPEKQRNDENHDF